VQLKPLIRYARRFPMNDTEKRILRFVHDAIGWTVIVYCWFLMIDHGMIAIRQQKDLLEGLFSFILPGIIACAIGFYLDMTRMAFNKSQTTVKQ
jgi:hypothetical protein